MQQIWSLIFKPAEDKDFYVQAGYGNVQRAAAEFQGSRIMFLACDPKLLELIAHGQEMYAFGAYNQINVCQMRALGTVSEGGDGPEIENLRKRLLNKIDRARLFRVEDIVQAHELIKEGKPFCFHPTEYAYSTYERG